MKTADRREARRKPNHEEFNLNFKTVWLITAGTVRNTNLASSEDFDEIFVF
jgi:hypothetical protein